MLHSAAEQLALHRAHCKRSASACLTGVDGRRHGGGRVSGAPRGGQRADLLDELRQAAQLHEALQHARALLIARALQPRGGLQHRLRPECLPQEGLVLVQRQRHVAQQLRERRRKVCTAAAWRGHGPQCLRRQEP